MAEPSDCVFCRIVSGTIPAQVVYRSDDVLSFLDINPLAEGHLLIIPREHYEEAKDLPPALCARLFETVPRLGRALLEVTGAAGFNVLLNNGRVAGQVVPHVHVHLIPRRPMDDLGYRWPAKTYAPGRAEQLARAYADVLGR